MKTETKLKWCSKYWNEIAVSGEHVYGTGLQVIVEARSGDTTIRKSGYTFAEALDKLFDSTLELALPQEHYVD